VTPVDRLVRALDDLASGYTFESKITVGGKVATLAKGRWVGGASEFDVESNGTSIKYRALPPRSWVLESGSDWVELDAAIGGGDPLDALRRPTAVEVMSDVAGRVELRATYPAAAFGSSGDTSVAVTITLAADGSVSARYTTGSGTGQAASETVLRPASGQEPIGAPSPVATG
jgi:hypothetical protein